MEERLDPYFRLVEIQIKAIVLALNNCEYDDYALYVLLEHELNRLIRSVYLAGTDAEKKTSV